ncbi:GNAT family N-acetyltransferase [Brachybacterium muris]|uniref:GNAT family N-acetyltransferase n=1 Tax=Brachybacterium muris TaxID=219301 RepID=UPI0022AB4BB8|nr:GNAT family N-acetyltransferase [Brachybacterium muris]
MGTHVHPGAGRSGVGRRLFERTRLAAQAAGIRHIDASIGSDNAPALAYYSDMGCQVPGFVEGVRVMVAQAAVAV